MIKLYFAPLEGVTTYTFRNTHKEMFSGCDGYYSPFITPSDKERVVLKNLRDVLPERNENINLTVQVLTNRPDSFMKFADKVKSLGYDHINVNLGCPSGTVIKKGRGSGFLRDPEGIDNFLYEIFESCDMKISVKTRTGFTSHDEFDKLMEIYNKYPLELLIIHPRTRNELYNGMPNDEVFEKAYKISKNKLCYNGNIFSLKRYNEIVTRFPDIDSIMLGRGGIMNPALFREIKTGKTVQFSEIVEFSERLAEKYLDVLGSDRYTLNKLKEIWFYVMWNYPDEKKFIKGIKKAEKLNDLLNLIRNFAGTF